MINYLFSGLDKVKFNQNQAKYLKKDIKNNSTILFISSLFEEYENNDKRLNSYLNLFKNINIVFKEIFLIDKRITIEESHNLIDKADIVFLMGGSPVKQMDSIKEYNLIDKIKTKKIVIGVSAGSINQSKKVIYKDEKIIKYDGLGLVDINIYPHLDWSNIELLNEISEVSNYITLTILPNDSFIRIENDITCIGKYYVVTNGLIDIKGKKYSLINYKGI